MQASERKILSAGVKEEPFIVNRLVRNWLFLGLVLIFFQIIIGGITRLTDSGLSITEWAVIQGTLPPLSEGEWIEAFEKYQVAARKQFETLHADMSLGEFKVIFFWEYFHRLWARMMGFIFLIPLSFFLWKKWVPRWLGQRLFVVFFLAALAAVFGWIMVASGLNDDSRTWVSAYKLIIHLGIATTLFGYLFWTYLRAVQPYKKGKPVVPSLRRWSDWTLGMLVLQILLGGLMAGMKAGLVHPHFPFFIEAASFYSGLLDTGANFWSDIFNYEPSVFIKGWIQVAHRGGAYILVILVILFIFKVHKTEVNKGVKKAANIVVVLLFLQFLLGVLTVINCIGRIPVYWGVAHQGMALLLLAALLAVRYQLFGNRNV